MNINVLDLLLYSGLNKFLPKNNNLVKYNKQIWNSYIIQLNLYQKEIAYIKNNFEEFKNILETVLYTFEHYYWIEYNNITFNSIKFWEKVLNNCIFLTSFKNKEYWFIKLNKFLEYSPPKKEEKKSIFLWNSLYDKIWRLIENNKFSVRNLINFWISDKYSRELYDFLKEKEVLVISKYNHTHKTYNIENYINIWGKWINNIISKGV